MQYEVLIDAASIHAFDAVVFDGDLKPGREIYLAYTVIGVRGTLESGEAALLGAGLSAVEERVFKGKTWTPSAHEGGGPLRVAAAFEHQFDGVLIRAGLFERDAGANYKKMAEEPCFREIASPAWKPVAEILEGARDVVDARRLVAERLGGFGVNDDQIGEIQTIDVKLPSDGALTIKEYARRFERRLHGSYAVTFHVQAREVVPEGAGEAPGSETPSARPADRVLSDDLLEISCWLDTTVDRSERVHRILMLVRNLSPKVSLANLRIPYDLDMARLARWQGKLTDASGALLGAQDQTLAIRKLLPRTSRAIPPPPADGQGQGEADHAWHVFHWKLVRRKGTDQPDPLDAVLLQMRPSYEIEHLEGHVLERWLTCSVLMDQGPDATPPYDEITPGREEEDGALFVKHSAVRTARWPEAKPPGETRVGDVVTNRVEWRSAIKPPTGAGEPLVRLTYVAPAVREVEQASIHWDPIACDADGNPLENEGQDYPEGEGPILPNTGLSAPYTYRWTLQRKPGASEPGMRKNFDVEFGVYTDYCVDYRGTNPWSIGVAVKQT